jgi:hypothetical protein
MKNIADLFDSYVKCGFKPLPLHKGTKIPVVSDWQTDWSVQKYRHFFVDNDQLNMGILLGDIIDVEGDDELANEVISEFVRHTPHPMFKSSKSIHHLFLSPDPTITICKVGKIEFRGHRHQSVIPPSVHMNGVEYKWLKGSEFPAPPMPQKMVEFLYKHRKVIKRAKRFKPQGKKSGHASTLCTKCNAKCFIHKKRLILEVRAFATLGRKWQCQKCRDVDLRQLCREIRDQMPQDS